MQMEIKKVGIDEFIAESYVDYGGYVNLSRAIPYVMDGLKPVYRRLIQTGLESDDDFVKTSGIIGTNMAHYHPHGDSSINQVIANLVLHKIFDGQGNFGIRSLINEDLSPAAPRYTEVKLNSIYRKQFSKLYPYVPKTKSYSGWDELRYIPTPIPFSLVFGALGIAIGIGTRIPPFTMVSLLDAYRHDDPARLKLNFGYTLDDTKGLYTLWDTGRASIVCNLQLTEGWSGDMYGYWVTGYPEIFRFNIPKLMEWRSEGKLLIRDETSTTPKVFFSRAKRIRTITDEDIKAELESGIRRLTGYKIVTNDGKTTRPIGIRDWIKITYNNYINLTEAYRLDNIKSLETDKIVWNNFRQVADLLVKGMPSNEIADKLEIEVDIVNIIGRKSINTLQTADPSTKLVSIENTIKSFEKLNGEDMITEFVEEGSNGFEFSD